MDEKTLVYPLFIIPVAKFHPRGFSSEVKDKFTKFELINNSENYKSKNTFILEEKGFEDLETGIWTCLRRYMDDVIQVAGKMPIKITQSWINVCEQNQGHHVHDHANSFLSWSMNIGDKPAQLEFLCPAPRFWLVPPLKNYTAYNAESQSITYEPGSLIVFPSTLKHYVGANPNHESRISLSGNTMIVGDLGSKELLTHASI